MRPVEARWIAAQIASLDAQRLSPFVNIGSSTAEVREIRQPHIDALVFAPMRDAGVEIIHTDLKQAPGVDVAGDLLDPAVRDHLRARKPRAVLSSNLLEHVPSPAEFASAIGSIVAPGGVAIVTVPHSYPYHADPIDTGFRPSPEQLASLFPGFRMIRGEVVIDSTYGQELRAMGWRGLRKGLRNLVGALRPRGDVGRAQRDRLRWLWRSFSTTCVVLEAPLTDERLRGERQRSSTTTRLT